jgi:hypothetical protein
MIVAANWQGFSGDALMAGYGKEREAVAALLGRGGRCLKKNFFHRTSS